MNQSELEAVWKALPPVTEFPFLVDWVKTYGRPSDPFIRIVDRYNLTEDGVVHVTREILARGYVPQVECEVSFSV